MSELRHIMGTACAAALFLAGFGAASATTSDADWPTPGATTGIDSACVARNLLMLPEESKWELVLTGGTKVSGRYLGVDSSRLHLSVKTKLVATASGWPAPPRDTVATIPLATIERAGYYAPRKKSGVGVLVGAFAGALLGGAIGRSLDEPCEPIESEVFEGCFDFHEEELILIVVGGLVGAAIGSSLESDTGYQPLYCPSAGPEHSDGEDR